MRLITQGFMCAATGLIGAIATVGHCAQPNSLQFRRVPSQSAISQIEAKYNTSITVGPGVDTDKLVSFSVPDTPTPTATRIAMWHLAHGLNAQVQPVIYIHHAPANLVRTGAAITTDKRVTFVHRRVSAQQAIWTIAVADGATVSSNKPTPGYVVLSALSLPASTAALEVQRQTHTAWTLQYRIVARQQQASPAERIIDYTAEGQPITESTPRPVQSTNRYAHRTANTNAIQAGDSVPQATSNNAGNPSQQELYPYNYPYGANPFVMQPFWNSNTPIQTWTQEAPQGFSYNTTNPAVIVLPTFSGPLVIR